MTRTELEATLPQMTLFKASLTTPRSSLSSLSCTWLEAAADLRRMICLYLDGRPTFDLATFLCGMIKAMPHGSEISLTINGYQLELGLSEEPEGLVD